MATRATAGTTARAAVVGLVVAGVVAAEGLLAVTGGLTAATAGSHLVAVVLASLGAVVVLRGGVRRYGWLMLGMASALATIALAQHWATLAYLDPRGAGDTAVLARLAAWWQDWVMVEFLLGLLLLPSLFPDGRPASPAWRRPVVVVTAGWLLWLSLWMLLVRDASNALEGAATAPPNPTGVVDLRRAPVVAEVTLVGSWLLLMLASVVVSIGSIVTRWRGADASSRRQLGLVLGSLLLLLAIALLSTIDGVMGGQVLVPPWVFQLAAGAWAVVLGVAVLGRGLYQTELVVNRGLVWAWLTVTVIAVYTVAVVTITSVVPATGDDVSALVATALVAVLFAPLHRALQRLVDRAVFGRRHDPYGVLASLGRRASAAGTPADTLQRVVVEVADSLRLPYVAIELDQRDGGVVRTSSGDRPPRDRPMLELPLAHRDRTVGRFIVAQRSPNERWHAADRRLLDAIATQVGPVADAARLTSDLRRSREQLVRAREEERRRIRRDLHDGLGPSLAAHTLGLDAVIDALEDDPSTVTARVEALKRDTQDLITDVRRLVHELRPPALDELGLIGALVAHVAVLDESGALAVRIRAEPDPLPQLSAAVEVAAYRIVAEAVTNTLRHARAASCTVRIELVDPPELGTAMLRLEVRDDGRGLPIVTRPGIGLTSMRERAEELGGMVTVTDAEDVGTVVAASLPCEVVAADVPLVPGTEVTHD